MGPLTSANRVARVALVLVVPAFLLGLAAGTQIQTQARRTSFVSSYTSLESVHLTQIAIAMQREQEVLKRDLLQARAALDAVQEEAARLSGSGADLQREIDEMKVAAGIAPLNGSGVIVTLDDAHLPPSRNPQLIAQAIVHSQDLTDVINAAWKGGARGIAINDERITGASACAGATIQINGTLLSPPFVIAIVGPVEMLSRVLNEPDELADLRARERRFGLRFDVVTAAEVRLLAYSGPITVRYAQPR
ncbi:MAG: DUF881 domain-containing protein [Chloroflexota bacterium]